MCRRLLPRDICCLDLQLWLIEQRVAASLGPTPLSLQAVFPVLPSLPEGWEQPNPENRDKRKIQVIRVLHHMKANSSFLGDRVGRQMHRASRTGRRNLPWFCEPDR